MINSRDPIKSFLLVSRTGSNSLHRRFTDDLENRAFDVLLSCYDALAFQENRAVVHPDAVEVEYRPGSKVKGYSELFRERPDLLQRYAYVCLWDEDLLVSSSGIEAMFELCSANNFALAQPSLTPASYFSHAITLSQPLWKWREVTFIEMMCPVFRSDTLRRVLPLFDLGFESGVDIAWSEMVERSGGKMAILDHIRVTHTEPVGGRKADNGFTGTLRYEDHIADMLARLELRWSPPLTRRAVSCWGGEVRSRSAFTLAVLLVVRAVPCRRNWRERARAVAVHLAHQLRQHRDAKRSRPQIARWRRADLG